MTIFVTSVYVLYVSFLGYSENKHFTQQFLY